MKLALFILLFAIPYWIYTQSDTLNQKDSLGRKQSYWIVYGKDQPQKGYPAEGKIEEGTYKDDRKHGEWKIYFNDGSTVRIEGDFLNGRPNGSYKKYYHNGNLQEKGAFQKRYYVGKWISYWENGNLQKDLFFNEKGKLDGKALYYYEEGGLEIEALFKDGVSIDTTKIYYPNGDLKVEYFNEPYYHPISTVSTDTVSIIDPCIKDSYSFPSKLNLNGFNKLYNGDNEILYEGELKTGCLWNGKYYIYDDNGILMKIEIWKNGEYHSEGQL